MKLGPKYWKICKAHVTKKKSVDSAKQAKIILIIALAININTQEQVRARQHGRKGVLSEQNRGILVHNGIMIIKGRRDITHRNVYSQWGNFLPSIPLRDVLYNNLI